MITLEVKDYREILKGEVVRFTDENWGVKVDSPEELRSNFFATPDFVVFAYDEGKLVGVVLVDVRKVYVGKQRKVAGMIGGVVVKKDYRHQGIAVMMLKMALEKLKDKKAVFALLCTEPETLGKLYEKVGFVPLRTPYRYYDINQGVKVETGGMLKILAVEDRGASEEYLNARINIGNSNF